MKNPKFREELQRLERIRTRLARATFHSEMAEFEHLGHRVGSPQRAFRPAGRSTLEFGALFLHPGRALSGPPVLGIRAFAYVVYDDLTPYFFLSQQSFGGAQYDRKVLEHAARIVCNASG